MRKLPIAAAIAAALLCLGFAIRAVGAPDEKPPFTLDEFFNSVSYPAVRISPDGNAVVVETERADWDANRFRNDLWLYRVGEPDGALVALTQSGHDHAPAWSPDGRWIAFLSDRPALNTKEDSAKDKDDDDQKAEPIDQVYVISAVGGEAFPVTSGDETVHAFSWSGDSRSILFATRTPQSKEEKEAYKKEWKDVIRFRESERGDAIYRVDVAAVQAEGNSGKIVSNFTPQTHELAKLADRASKLVTSPNGEHLAVLTESRSERWESTDPFAIYAIELTGSGAATPRVVSHTHAFIDRVDWAKDNRHVFFYFLNGAAEGPYVDAQPRVYWADAGNPSQGDTGSEPSEQVRWAANFTGAVEEFAVLSGGELFAAGRLGTEVQPYTENGPHGEFIKHAGWAGTYETLSAANRSPRVAFVYSTIERPSEVYIADSTNDIEHARAITSFNRLFTQRAMPRGKPYRWTADDGTAVEGMLIYPPGEMDAKNLPLFVLIHGGPEDADGNHFEADWYQWATLAATNGWLVFEPNYRGSIGYGDAFALGIIPHIVSRPGKDILEGVDALVKDGIADPNRLTVGGYSYGGYMTNWLITQTTRFKAAVSGAGAVEHVVNWGNDDTTMDDAYFLGGLPWEAETNWNAEAAIWQFSKVTTPTHVVGGADDIRVYVGEDYLLERALYTRGIPASLLIFPGEGHSLDKNPWHGKIKVRDELKWLEKYGGK
ncbi:MAG: prolyl oligopeptidase family serine peptidase [Candidatus Acidiferrales bacterium]